MRPSNEDIKLFANALQLSINSSLSSVEMKNDGLVVIKFDNRTDGDHSLELLLKFFSGEWDKSGRSFAVKNAEAIDWRKLTLFLQITRMQEDSIMTLAMIDASAYKIAKELGFDLKTGDTDNVQSIVQAVFERVKKKGFTLRQLADMSGLTQASLSNFKAGKDIKLSNLMRILKALDMKLRLK